MPAGHVIFFIDLVVASSIDTDRSHHCVVITDGHVLDLVPDLFRWRPNWSGVARLIVPNIAEVDVPQRRTVISRLFTWVEKRSVDLGNSVAASIVAGSLA